MNAALPPQPALYALFFRSLRTPSHTLAFPCDERGQVQLDDLSEDALREYLYARVVRGHEYAHPTVVQSAPH